MSRLSLELSEPTRERLERLVVLADADSRTEVIRSALALYEVILGEIKEGREVVIHSPDGGRKALVLV